VVIQGTLNHNYLFSPNSFPKSLCGLWGICWGG